MYGVWLKPRTRFSLPCRTINPSVPQTTKTAHAEPKVGGVAPRRRTRSLPHKGRLKIQIADFQWSRSGIHARQTPNTGRFERCRAYMPDLLNVSRRAEPVAGQRVGWVANPTSADCTDVGSRPDLPYRCEAQTACVAAPHTLPQRQRSSENPTHAEPARQLTFVNV